MHFKNTKIWRSQIFFSNSQQIPLLQHHKQIIIKSFTSPRPVHAHLLSLYCNQVAMVITLTAGFAIPSQSVRQSRGRTGGGAEGGGGACHRSGVRWSGSGDWELPSQTRTTCGISYSLRAKKNAHNLTASDYNYLYPNKKNILVIIKKPGSYTVLVKSIWQTDIWMTYQLTVSLKLRLIRKTLVQMSKLKVLMQNTAQEPEACPMRHGIGFQLTPPRDRHTHKDTFGLVDEPKVPRGHRWSTERTIN